MKCKDFCKKYVIQHISKWVTLLVVVGAICAFFLPSNYLMSVLKWIESLGPIWGTLALLIVYVFTIVLFLPGFTLTIFSGYWCGLLIGTLLSWVGSILGAVSCFLLGRWAGSDMVKKWTTSYPLFHAIVNVLSRSDGWKLVLLLRLSPLTPFTLINYLLSATPISSLAIPHSTTTTSNPDAAEFMTYFYSTLIGVLPPTALFCYLGTAAKNLSDIVESHKNGEPAEINKEQEAISLRIFIVGLVITVIVGVLITVISSRSIQKELKSIRSKREQDSPGEDGEHDSSGDDSEPLNTNVDDSNNSDDGNVVDDSNMMDEPTPPQEPSESSMETFVRQDVVNDNESAWSDSGSEEPSANDSLLWSQYTDQSGSTQSSYPPDPQAGLVKLV